MTMKIKAGSLSEFFAAVKETARELDAGITPTPKHRVWLDVDDLAALLKPQRKELLVFLREHEEATMAELSAALHRSARSLRPDLDLLSRYDLIQVLQPKDPGHKVFRPTFCRETLEFVARL